MASMLTCASAPAGAETFEHILAAPSGLVVLSSTDVPSLVDQFRAFARHTGQALYLWQPEQGLMSLRDAQGGVPDCQRLGNALRHMQHSLHFGVYFLVGVTLPLSAVDCALLRKLARAPKEQVRRVVLVDPPATLVKFLGELVVNLQCVDNRAPRLRLRDGRWLLATA
ncbi:MAG: hypothetical protein ABI114_00715 [Rhodanobacter sp.]